MPNSTQKKPQVTYEMPAEEQFRDVLHKLNKRDGRDGDNFTLVEFLKVSARIQVKHLNSVDTQVEKRYSQNKSKR